MERKSLTDQLDSTCQDYFGAPQATGIPLRDEVLEGNFLEPEFGVFRVENGTLKDYTRGFHIPADQIRCRERENVMKDTLKNILREETESKYIVKDLYHEGNYLSVESIKPETMFFFDHPEDRDGGRFWKVWLCNCRNQDLRFQRASIFVCNDECQNPKVTKCHRLTISYNTNLEPVEQKNVFRELCIAFQLAPVISLGYSSVFTDPALLMEFPPGCARDLDWDWGGKRGEVSSFVESESQKLDFALKKDAETSSKASSEETLQEWKEPSKKKSKASSSR
eukprot:GHVP01024046.1.p1 GENE.GHVP01024046.1~~GHVP01024046.1.p1  ORF type:complete len:280 (-),score=40.32 GHVP01024046.1:42-881(-)